MFRYSNSIICGSSLCLIVFSANAQQKPSASVDVAPLVDQRKLAALDATAIGKMTIDDPLLKIVYSQFFLRSFEQEPGWYVAARADLAERGDSATPILLQLFKENPELEFQANLLSRIDQFPSINIEPYLVAARNLFNEEGVALPARTCYSIAWIIERFGNIEDFKILMRLKQHPDKEVGFFLRPKIERMKARLGVSNVSEEVQEPIVNGATPDVQNLNARSSNKSANVGDIAKEHSVRGGWGGYLIGLAMFTGLAFLWYAYRERRGRMG